MIKPFHCTEDQIERISDVLAMGPLTRRPVDQPMIDAGLFAHYDDDETTVEGTPEAFRGPQAFYTHSSEGGVIGRIRECWL